MKYIARLIVLGMLAVVSIALTGHLDWMVAAVSCLILLVLLITVLIGGTHHPDSVDFK